MILLTNRINMNILYKSVLFLSFILLVGCYGRNQGTSTEDSSDSVVIKPDSVEENAYLKGIDTSMNDTIVGVFDGRRKETLIAELIEERTSENCVVRNWRIVSKSNSIKPMILQNRYSVRFVEEGDLDGNGTDEFGIRVEGDVGMWNSYIVYSCINGEWKVLLDSIFTYSPHFYEKLDNGKDVVQTTAKKGFLKIRFSDVRNDEICIVDTIVRIKDVYQQFVIKE